MAVGGQSGALLARIARAGAGREAAAAAAVAGALVLPGLCVLVYLVKLHSLRLQEGHELGAAIAH